MVYMVYMLYYGILSTTTQALKSATLSDHSPASSVKGLGVATKAAKTRVQTWYSSGLSG